MNFKTHLEESWKLMLEHLIPLIFMTLLMVAVSFCTFMILAPVVYAGYMYAILLMAREGREPVLQDIFSQMRLFLPLFAFGLGSAVLVSVGYVLFVLPGVILSFLIPFACLYMVLLMSDKNLGLLDAIVQSFSMVTGDSSSKMGMGMGFFDSIKERFLMASKKQVIDHVILMILIIAMNWLGALVAVGWLVTTPMSAILLVKAYNEVERNTSVSGPY